MGSLSDLLPVCDLEAFLSISCRWEGSSLTPATAATVLRTPLSSTTGETRWRVASDDLKTISGFCDRGAIHK